MGPDHTWTMSPSGPIGTVSLDPKDPGGPPFPAGSWSQKPERCSRVGPYEQTFLATIFERSRSYIGCQNAVRKSSSPVFALSDKVHQKSRGRKTRGCKGSPPERTCFHAFSPQKRITGVGLRFFMLFRAKKYPTSGKTTEMLYPYLLNCGNTIPGGVSK